MLRLRGRVPSGRTIAEIYELQLEESPIRVLVDIFEMC
jgi:hypothetical protein